MNRRRAWTLPDAPTTTASSSGVLPTAQGDRARQLSRSRRDYERARLALDMGKARTACTLLEACLEVEPDHPEYLGLYGLALCRCQDNLPRAQELCERALADRPADARLHAYLGQVHEARGHAAEARACYEEALRRDADDTTARSGLERLARPQGFSFRSLLRLRRR